MSPKNINLRPWQESWAQRAYEILLKNHGYIDSSTMGTGKTFLLLWLAQQFGFAVMIICPPIMIETWRQIAAEYGVKVIDILSYQILRSQKDAQLLRSTRRLDHGWLYRHDNIAEGGVRHVTFTPTEEYYTLVQRGVFLVIDELQFIKNRSSQREACNALLRPIINGGHSRFAMLSGTPFHTEEQAVNLLKTIGYIRSPRLYGINRNTGQIELEGLQDLINACMFINPAETAQIISSIPLVKNKITKICHTLYVRVVREYIVGGMPSPVIKGVTFDIKNGFFALDDSETNSLQNAIDDIAVAAQYDESTGQIGVSSDKIKKTTTHALMEAETAKIGGFVRVARAILEFDPKGKLSLALNYTRNIERIASLLREYNPMILNGKTIASKRQDILDKFNFNPQYRLLIMNTAVGGTGINLHDTVGNSPRYMLISPSYKLLEIVQATGRMWRDGTKSNVYMRIFYGRGSGPREMKIYEALARGSGILRSSRASSIEDQIVLPGDYEAEEEM